MLPHLDAQKIIKTIDRLNRRIAERFPDSGLSQVSLQVHKVADKAQSRSQTARRPNILLRLGVAILLLLLISVVAASVAVLLDGSFELNTGWDAVQGVEAGISASVFIGAAIIFLITVENRMKRKKMLTEIEDLRELSHIIDMHQLTKDPERVLRPHKRTASSPTDNLSPFELSRYLDYCSELLALLGKVAGIYSQGVHDAVVLDAIDSIENLTTGLSRKIWQKMIILGQWQNEVAAEGRANVGEAAPPAVPHERPPVEDIAPSDDPPASS